MSDKTQTTALVQPTPPIVRELVRRFGDHIDAYKSGRYNETQLRREFIDPLFRGLGWDVDNEQGYAEAYKDVIHEAAVRVEGAVKAPDYSFRIGGVRKFFLEAKKPSINIKGDPGPAYQLRRYAWSAKLPLSILTDFEEFAVYDCRVRPVKTDSPATARVLYLKYTDYLAHWHEIASIFSREAILTGSFDKYVESKKRKRGTAEVDAAFLQEIETWRETLARNLALRNAALTQRQLNFAVQVTVDRIIFLRMCEDRGIEDYARLMALLNGDRVYDRLMQLFREADQRYNSGLFHFQREPGRGDPDELTPGLAIDDRILKDIIKGLYYPDSPYEFSVLPADILGHVYEQFLGKVIRLTSGHRAKIEEKPEVRKAGGVYYTPTYIVQYIVKHTVGKLLEDRSIKWIGREKKRAVNQPRLDKPLRVLDPACGSGSFLLGAYQYLLDWHLDYYTTHDPESWAKKKNPPIYLRGASSEPRRPRPRLDPKHGTNEPRREDAAARSNYRLTVAERKRILVDHIFGVDIDTQAVEVTKLSLLLKVLEGETTHSLGTHLWYEKERALPDLASNIKCGNSLIGPDFYDTSGRQMDMFDEEERYRINVFDWPTEFPHVFPSPPYSPGLARGPLSSPRAATPARRKTTVRSESTPADSPGFDAVIGNPPYVRIQTLIDSQAAEVEHLKRRYKAASEGNFDIYVVFVERGLGLLGKVGRFGMILPNKFFTTRYGRNLRRMIADGNHLARVVNFGSQQVFESGTTYTCLLFLSASERADFTYCDVSSLDDWARMDSARSGTIPNSDVRAEPWSFIVGPAAPLVKRLRANHEPLESLAQRIFQGFKTGADSVFIVEERGQDRFFSKALDDCVELEGVMLQRLFKSGNMKRYRLLPNERYIIVPYDGGSLMEWGMIQERAPRAAAYLEQCKPILESRERGRFSGAEWYCYSRNQALEVMPRSKILTADLNPHANYCFDATGEACFPGGAAGGYGVLVDDPIYVLGLLNSRVVDIVVEHVASHFRGGWFAYDAKTLRQLPIRTIDFSDPADKSRHDRMVRLVQQMLDLHKQLAAAKTAHEKTAIQRQIDATDRQIDQLVYDLYGLTADEIRIVEEAIPK